MLRLALLIGPNIRSWLGKSSPSQASPKTGTDTHCSKIAIVFVWLRIVKIANGRVPISWTLISEICSTVDKTREIYDTCGSHTRQEDLEELRSVQTRDGLTDTLMAEENHGEQMFGKTELVKHLVEMMGLSFTDHVYQRVDMLSRTENLEAVECSTS